MLQSYNNNYGRTKIIKIKQQIVTDNIDEIILEQNKNKNLNSPSINYELHNQSFDPFKGSPPNEFMSKLQQRFNQTLGINVSN